MLLALLACSDPPPAPPAPAPAAPAPKKVSRSVARTGLAEVADLKFPADEATLNGWITAGDHAAIEAHAWKLWAAATGDLDGAPAFTRWRTPANGLDEVSLTPDTLQPVAHPLAPPTGLLGAVETPVLSSVLWSPAAALSIGMQDLLSETALAQRVEAKVASIELDRRSVVVQPAWFVPTGGRYRAVPSWPGPTDGSNRPGDWGRCVWVDVEEPGVGTGDGSVDTTCAADASSRTPATTYGLGAFVHFRLDANEAPAVAATRPDSREGDPVLLVGLNLASREVDRWTWQAFWWQAETQAPAPAAATRPADQRYAMCTAWSMVEPGPGAPVTCYNPWLEAGLSAEALPGSTSWTWKGTKYAPRRGVETNCMSCHALAAWDPKGTADLRPTAARAVELTPPAGGVRLDFLWSVARAIPGSKVPSP